MNKVDWAWLAGLYEGEGCCSTTGRSPYIFIKMTDKDVIEKVQSLFGTGSIYTIASDGNRKEAYKWQIGKREHMENFINSTSEFLGTRRKEKFLEVKQIYTERDIKNNRRIT